MCWRRVLQCVGRNLACHQLGQKQFARYFMKHPCVLSYEHISCFYKYSTCFHTFLYVSSCITGSICFYVFLHRFYITIYTFLHSFYITIYMFLQVKPATNWGENNLPEILQIWDFTKCCRVNVHVSTVERAGRTWSKVKSCFEIRSTRFLENVSKMRQKIETKQSHSQDEEHKKHKIVA